MYNQSLFHLKVLVLVQMSGRRRLCCGAAGNRSPLDQCRPFSNNLVVYATVRVLYIISKLNVRLKYLFFVFWHRSLTRLYLDS